MIKRYSILVEVDDDQVDNIEWKATIKLQGIGEYNGIRVLLVNDVTESMRSVVEILKAVE